MIKFVSFNIRCDFNQDEENCFCFRKDLIVKKIRKEKPDIICFQEVLPHVALWLKETFEEYYIVGCARSEVFDDEQEAIAYRKDRFNLVTMDTFWLSLTPHVPGSRYAEQSICPRVTAEVVLHDLQDNTMLRVVNTHLDHEGSLARELGLKQIMNKITNAVSFPDAKIILAGDFNAEPNMPEMQIMEQYKDFTDATGSALGTFHDYGKLKTPEKIDYIFVQSPLRGEAVEKWTECEDGVFLSDHYPISVEIYSE